MEAKPAQQNIQDSFLNTARKERHNITIYLVSGVKLTGRIRSFDKYSVVLETSNQGAAHLRACDFNGRDLAGRPSPWRSEAGGSRVSRRRGGCSSRFGHRRMK